MGQRIKNLKKADGYHSTVDKSLKEVIDLVSETCNDLTVISPEINLINKYFGRKEKSHIKPVLLTVIEAYMKPEFGGF